MEAQAVYTKAQLEKARRLSEMVPFLSRGREKGTGVGYVTFPSNDDPEHTGHNTNGMRCSCAGWKRRRSCSHALAYTIARDRAQNELIALAQRCRVKDCGNMRESRTGRCREHFAALVDELGV